jgi:transposase
MMSNVMTIGLDIAKSVFQVHGVDAAGEVAVRKKLTRGRLLAFFESLPRCLVGIEACRCGGGPPAGTSISIIV